MRKAISRKVTATLTATAEAKASQQQDTLAVERHLVSNAIDAAGYAVDTHRAFVAVEGLVTPTGVNDDERIALRRCDLGALLRVLNESMGQRLQEACDAAEAVRQLVR